MRYRGLELISILAHLGRNHSRLLIESEPMYNHTPWCEALTISNVALPVETLLLHQLPKDPSQSCWA